MLEISVTSNVDAVSRRLSVLAHRQLPFAEARTVTELAKLAADAEKAAIPQAFENPTPFTVNSVAVQPARKDLPIARVYIGDKAAQYLAPHEFGGVQFLGRKPADVVPVNVPRTSTATCRATPFASTLTVLMCSWGRSKCDAAKRMDSGNDLRLKLYQGPDAAGNRSSTARPAA